MRKSSDEIRAFLATPAGKAEIDRMNKQFAEHPEPSEQDLKEVPAFGGGHQQDFRPIKRPITVRIDADVLAWLKAKKGAYQTN